MATCTSLFLVAAILVAVHSYRIEDKLKADFNELQQDVEEMMAVKKEDNMLEKRTAHGCKYPGEACYNEVYSYGCRDIKKRCELYGACKVEVCITPTFHFII